VEGGDDKRMAWLVVCSWHLSRLFTTPSFSYQLTLSLVFEKFCKMSILTSTPLNYRIILRKVLAKLRFHRSSHSSLVNMPIDPKTDDFVNGGKWLAAPGSGISICCSIVSQDLMT